MLCIPVRYQSIFPGDSSDPNEAFTYSERCLPKIMQENEDDPVGLIV